MVRGKEYKLEGRHWKKEKAFQRAKRRRETEREREEKKLENAYTFGMKLNLES